VFTAQHYFVSDRQAHVAHPSRDHLARFVTSQNGIVESLLRGVYTAESVDQALSMRAQLEAHECVVTAEGSMIGANWFSPAIDDGESTGVLETASRVRALREKVSTLDAVEREKKDRMTKLRAVIADLASELSDTRNQLTVKSAELEQLRAQHNTNVVEHGQSVARLEELTAKAQLLQES